MIGEIPISDACHYMDAHDTETDQPGRFPITSAGGHKNTMVAVELDGNYIDAEPMKSRSAKELTKSYKRIYARWKAT